MGAALRAHVQQFWECGQGRRPVLQSSTETGMLLWQHERSVYIHAGFTDTRPKHDWFVLWLWSLAIPVTRTWSGNLDKESFLQRKEMAQKNCNFSMLVLVTCPLCFSRMFQKRFDQNLTIDFFVWCDKRPPPEKKPAGRSRGPVRSDEAQCSKPCTSTQSTILNQKAKSLDSHVPSLKRRRLSKGNTVQLNTTLCNSTQTLCNSTLLLNYIYTLIQSDLSKYRDILPEASRVTCLAQGQNVICIAWNRTSNLRITSPTP